MKTLKVANTPLYGVAKSVVGNTKKFAQDNKFDVMIPLLRIVFVEKISDSSSLLHLVNGTTFQVDESIEELNFRMEAS